jgi:hypothetical protein
MAGMPTKFGGKRINDETTERHATVVRKDLHLSDEGLRAGAGCLMLSGQAARPIAKSKPLTQMKTTKRSQISLENQSPSFFIRLRKTPILALRIAI